MELLDERGVEDVRHGDMFALRDLFERDRFRSVLVVGTQAGLAGVERPHDAYHYLAALEKR